MALQQHRQNDTFSITIDHKEVFSHYLKLYYMTTDDFTNYPVTEMPYTFSSGTSTSTIDYIFYRSPIAPNMFLVDDSKTIAQHRPLVLEFRLPARSTPTLIPAQGDEYWRSKVKQEAFPTAVAGLPPAYTHGTHLSLQGLYDKLSNLISLSTKRPARSTSAPTWSSKLSQEDKASLDNARETVKFLSAQATDVPDRVAQLREAKVRLETMTTSLMKKVLEAETDTLSSQASDQGAAWKVISRLRDTMPECPIPTDSLVTHFSELSHPPEIPILPLPIQVDPSTILEPLQPEELSNALRDTNLASAPGPDGITPSFLVSTFSSGPAFETLFNFLAMCLILAYVPLQWREAMLFVLYKGSGNPCDPNNYRAIALTSVFGKLFERILLARLLKWF
jgi:hypothetical protein